jgi:hypothetical protein
MEETDDALEYDYNLEGGRESSSLSQSHFDLVSLDFLSRGSASRSEIVIVLVLGFFWELWRSPFAVRRSPFSVQRSLAGVWRLAGETAGGVLFAIFFES